MLTRIAQHVSITTSPSGPTDYDSVIAKQAKFRSRSPKRSAFANLAAKFDNMRSKVQRMTGIRDSKLNINGSDFKAVIFSDCADCELNLEANCTKVFVERCKNVVLRICGNVRWPYRMSDYQHQLDET